MQNYHKSYLPELKKSCLSVQHFYIYNNVTYKHFCKTGLPVHNFSKRVTSLLPCNILAFVAYLDSNKSIVRKDICCIYNNIAYITTCSPDKTNEFLV